MVNDNENEEEEAKQTDKQPPIQSVTHFHGEVKAPVHTGSGNINTFYSGVSLAALRGCLLPLNLLWLASQYRP